MEYKVGDLCTIGPFRKELTHSLFQEGELCRVVGIPMRSPDHYELVRVYGSDLTQLIHKDQLLPSRKTMSDVDLSEHSFTEGDLVAIKKAGRRDTLTHCFTDGEICVVVSSRAADGMPDHKRTVYLCSPARGTNQIVSVSDIITVADVYATVLRKTEHFEEGTVVFVLPSPSNIQSDSSRRLKVGGLSTTAIGYYIVEDVPLGILRIHNHFAKDKPDKSILAYPGTPSDASPTYNSPVLRATVPELVKL